MNTKLITENVPPETTVYLDRIGYRGRVASDLDTLRRVILHHIAAIPFENLNPFLGWPVRLDSESLRRKMIDDGRGGYCFEHNLLLKDMLEQIGFHVVGLAARVLWNMPPDTISPRGHMLLLVEAEDEPHIVDVGFGGMTLSAPLRLEPDLVQETPHEPFRLTRAGESFLMQSTVGDEWKTLYRFDLQEQHLADYEVTNWYLSNHPRSHFVTGLIAARTVPGRRFALRGHQFATHSIDGTTERTSVDSIAELRRLLEEVFVLRLPESEGLDALLARKVFGFSDREQ